MCFKQHPVYELVELGQIQSHALGSLPSVDGDALTYMPVARSRGTRLLVEGVALPCLVQAGMFEDYWFGSCFFLCREVHTSVQRCAGKLCVDKGMSARGILAHIMRRTGVCVPVLFLCKELGGQMVVRWTRTVELP